MAARWLAPCLALLTVSLLSALGCGSGATNSDSAIEASHFKKLVLNYVVIVRKNQGRIPKHQEALAEELLPVFKEYLSENGMELRELLTSPRDGKPYVFVTEEGFGRRRSRIVGYEQEGVGGLRYVGLTTGDVLEVDETGFQDLVPSQLRNRRQ